MQLGGIAFSPVMNASGAQGFFGEGYPFHYWWHFAGLTFRKCGLTTKTTTMQPRLRPDLGQGNMPMKEDGITPKEFFPRCIVARPRHGVTLNAVGLSGPGAPELLRRNRWQQHRGGPLMVSFMSVAPSVADRLDELDEFVSLLSPTVHQWNSPVGLEVNVSCPNVDVEADPTHQVDEIGQSLDRTARLRVPVQIKINALMSPAAAAQFATHEACAAITMGNTLPWGKKPDRIDWAFLFGSLKSPLAHLKGGGLSGKPLAPIVAEWIAAASDCGVHKPIWACGGIYSAKELRAMKAAGASGVQLGTVAILRPWRMRTLIRYANELFG